MNANTNPVIWFEIPVKDMARARRFYESVLNVTLAPVQQVNDTTLSMFPMEMGKVGAGGALIQNAHAEPSFQGTTIYFAAGPIDPVLERVTKAGGAACLGRTSIGEYGFIAQFTDSEGNRVALHEPPAMK
jgi:predicted enzyme related to lactoylglutathione lyase